MPQISRGRPTLGNLSTRSGGSLSRSSGRFVSRNSCILATDVCYFSCNVVRYESEF